MKTSQRSFDIKNNPILDRYSSTPARCCHVTVGVWYNSSFAFTIYTTSEHLCWLILGLQTFSLLTPLSETHLPTAASPRLTFQAPCWMETPPCCFVNLVNVRQEVMFLFLRRVYNWSQRLLFWATDEEVALPLLQLLPVSLGTVG